MSYERLIEAMIDAQSALLGQHAVELARGVRGVHVDADGTVEAVTVDGKTAADDLASAYVDAVGPPARAALQEVAAEFADDVDLPPSLE